MRQVAEFTVFFTIAAAAHLAIFQHSPDGTAPSAGNAGGDTVTLAASSEAVARMVAEWTRPVEVLDQIDAPKEAVMGEVQNMSLSPPTSFERAPQPLPLSKPLPPTTSTDIPPDFDSKTPAPVQSALKSSVRPPTRRQIQSAPSRSAQPAIRQVAAGSGGRQAVGEDGGAATSVKQPTASPELMAAWGGHIRAAIERRKRYPSGTRTRGTATLSISISSLGTLSSVKITRSTGDAALDQAALAAVKRARFQAAPRGLAAGVHHFSLPITFSP